MSWNVQLSRQDVGRSWSVVDFGHACCRELLARRGRGTRMPCGDRVRMLCRSWCSPSGLKTRPWLQCWSRSSTSRSSCNDSKRISNRRRCLMSESKCTNRSPRRPLVLLPPRPRLRFPPSLPGAISGTGLFFSDLWQCAQDSGITLMCAPVSVCNEYLIFPTLCLSLLQSRSD